MCPIETPEGPNIGLIGYLVELRPDQPVRLHRDAVPQGREGSRHRRDRVSRRRRRGRVRHRAGERARRRAGQLPRRARARAFRSRRDRLRRARRGPLHGRLAEAARLGRHRAHPVPRARRREPRAHGRQHATSGRPAAPRDRAVHRHRCRGPRRPRRGRRAARRRRRSRSSTSPATPSPSSTRRTAAPRTASRSSAARTRARASTRSRSSTTGEQVKKGDVLADGPSTHRRRARARQEPARRVHALEGSQLRGRDRVVASAS